MRCLEGCSWKLGRLSQICYLNRRNESCVKVIEWIYALLQVQQEKIKNAHCLHITKIFRFKTLQNEISLQVFCKYNNVKWNFNIKFDHLNKVFTSKSKFGWKFIILISISKLYDNKKPFRRWYYVPRVLHRPNVLVQHKLRYINVITSPEQSLDYIKPVRSFQLGHVCLKETFIYGLYVLSTLMKPYFKFL